MARSRLDLLRSSSAGFPGKAGLDSLPLLEQLYDDPLRVYINSGIGEPPYNATFLNVAEANPEPGGSRVSSRDQIASYHTGTEAAANGWSFRADRKRLSNFLDTIRPPNSKLSKEESHETDAKWEQLFDDECPTGTIRVRWPAYLGLATRQQSSRLKQRGGGTFVIV